MQARRNGFTLVEVLVALVVTSLTVAIVMNAALQAKTRAVASLDKEEAILLARAVIAARSTDPFDPAVRNGSEGDLRWTSGERAIATDTGGRFLLAEIGVAVQDSRGVALAALQARKVKSAPRS